MIQNVQMIPRNAPIWQDNEWKKHLSGAISSSKQLLELLELDPEQLPYQVDWQADFIQKVPKPYLDRIQKGQPWDPLLLQVLPLSEENQLVKGFVNDPLAEHNNISPGLLHKYKSRVLFMLATHCAINCRYCFRREFPYSDNTAGKQAWQQLNDYLLAHPEINEVILSGGDPLAVNDQYLHDFVNLISQVPHLKRLRIHTRLPIVIPQRVTTKLLSLASSSRLQMVLVTHINHPQEIDSNVKIALNLLSKAGFSLLNQSVLLDKINDSVEVLAELSEMLFAQKVQPYYLHLLDKVVGVHHFEVSESRALAIYQQLQKELAGFLVPKLVREIAGRSHKVILANN